MKKTLLIFFMLLLLSFSSICSANYSVSENELTTLNNNLMRLKQINTSLQSKSKQQALQIQKLQTSLLTAENKSMELQNQIKALQLTSKNQEELLTSANQSLTKYEAEMKKENNRLKTQRNIAYAIVAFLIFKEVK